MSWNSRAGPGVSLSMSFVALVCLLATTAQAGRIEKIREDRLGDLKAIAAKAGLSYPVDELYLRAFKQERVLELWAGPRNKPLTLLKSYPFCAASGELGPKRMEGDLQVPEGLYEISEFNPGSNFHLSMKVSYPNRSDRARGRKGNLGGLIYLHGNCASIGCIAIQDEPIEEVYLLALDSKASPIRFDIFPMRLDAEARKSAAGSPHFEFWMELTRAYTNFELVHRPPKFKIDAKTGAYAVEPPPS